MNGSDTVKEHIGKIPLSKSVSYRTIYMYMQKSEKNSMWKMYAILAFASIICNISSNVRKRRFRKTQKLRFSHIFYLVVFRCFFPFRILFSRYISSCRLWKNVFTFHFTSTILIRRAVRKSRINLYEAN